MNKSELKNWVDKKLFIVNEICKWFEDRKINSTCSYYYEGVRDTLIEIKNEL